MASGLLAEQAIEEPALASTGGLFAKFRNRVPAPQGRGQVFERMVKAFLSQDPVFKERFSAVWLWSGWPRRPQGEPDIGIDTWQGNERVAFARSNASSTKVAAVLSVGTSTRSS
jgi:hypothetical protein